MPIVPSRSRRIQELLARLGSPVAAERDAAVAGLTLLGSRVVEPLGAFLPAAERAARLGAVDVLDRLEDRAALPLLLDLARDTHEPVARRALEAAGARQDARAASGLAALLGPEAPASRRRAAARALARLLAGGLVEALDPLAARLLDEREEAGLRVAILEDLLALEPPLSPAIPKLLRALEGLGPVRRGRTEAASLRARAAIHEALAALDSRAALYDLRETIEAHPRGVMPAFLRAAGRIGDASIVPALARAVAEDPPLLEPCAEAFAAIVAREKLKRTARSGKAARPEHRAALDRLWEKANRRR